MRWRGVLELRMLDACAHRARARLRDRADRLPGRRRRRLRDPLEPAVGDGLPARHRAHAARRARPAHADLRDRDDVPARARALAPARPRAPGGDLRAVPDRQRPRAAAGRVRPAQRRGLRGADGARSWRASARSSWAWSWLGLVARRGGTAAGAPRPPEPRTRRRR